MTTLAAEMNSFAGEMGQQLQEIKDSVRTTCTNVRNQGTPIGMPVFKSYECGNTLDSTLDANHSMLPELEQILEKERESAESVSCCDREPEVREIQKLIQQIQKMLKTPTRTEGTTPPPLNPSSDPSSATPNVDGFLQRSNSILDISEGDRREIMDESMDCLEEICQRQTERGREQSFAVQGRRHVTCRSYRDYKRPTWKEKEKQKRDRRKRAMHNKDKSKYRREVPIPDDLYSKFLDPMDSRAQTMEDILNITDELDHDFKRVHFVADRAYKSDASGARSTADVLVDVSTSVLEQELERRKALRRKDGSDK